MVGVGRSSAIRNPTVVPTHAELLDECSDAIVEHAPSNCRTTLDE